MPGGEVGGLDVEQPPVGQVGDDERDDCRPAAARFAPRQGLTDSSGVCEGSASRAGDAERHPEQRPERR